MTALTTPAELGTWADQYLAVGDLFRVDFPTSSPDDEITPLQIARGSLVAADLDPDTILAEPYSLDLGDLGNLLSVVDGSGDGPRSAALWALFPLARAVDALGYLYSSPARVYSGSRWGVYGPRHGAPAFDRIAHELGDETTAVVAIASAYAESVDNGDDDSMIAVAGVGIDYRDAATLWDLVKLARDHYSATYGENVARETTDAEILEDSSVSVEHALTVLLAIGDVLASIVDLVDLVQGDQ